MASLQDSVSALKIPFNEPNVSQRLSQKLAVFLKPIQHDRRIAIVCVGTDRSTGDSLGPLVGAALSREKNTYFDLYGTLDNPVHAMNLGETLLKISQSSRHPFVIGVDACLGNSPSVGCIQLGAGPIHPGAGVNKKLPPVGDIHMTGVVNVGGFMEYFVLQNTRLNLVMKMSDVIAQSLLGTIHVMNREVAAGAMPD